MGTCPQSAWLLRLDGLLEHSLSIQIFHRCTIYRADHEDLIEAWAAALRYFCSSSLVAPPLGLDFVFGPTSAYVSLSGVCSQLRQNGVKAEADWGTLTPSGQGGVWQPQLGCAQIACCGGDQQEVAKDWGMPTRHAHSGGRPS